jgi:hypothetical protein
VSATSGVSAAAVVYATFMVLAMHLSVCVAAVMLPTIPALASAKAKTAAEFVANDVPARAVPAVLIPTVSIAVVFELVIATSPGPDGRRRRRRRSVLAKVWVVRLARRHDLRADFRQRPAGIPRLRFVLHDRPNAVHDKPITGADSAPHESRLPASGFDLITRAARGWLCGGGQARRQQCSEPE